jgi:hypothetical protein
MKFKSNARTAIHLAWICLFFFGLPLTYGIDNDEVLKATPAQFDFGTIDEGVPAAVTTIIQNVGKTRVEITNVRTS